MSSTTTTPLTQRAGVGLQVSPEGWDHISVTHGVTPRPERRRAIVLAVAALAAVGLGVAALVSPPVPPGRAHSGTSTTPTTPTTHSRLGPVVHADPSSHSRLGPVVRHGALPRQWKS
jgi:hypothetical protein